MKVDNFSVLITTYKGEKAEYLKASLNSILVEQTLIPNQVVLVEDGPLTKELEDVVVQFEKEFSDILQVVRCKENRGQSKASAEGFNHIRNEIFARMDSDDVSVQYRFEHQYDFLLKHPEVDVVGGWIAEFNDDPNRPQSLRMVEESHDAIVKTFKKRMPFNNVTVMMRKQKVSDAGGYGRETVNEDYSLFAHMWVNGAIFHNLQEVLVDVRVGNNMLGRRTDFRIFRDWVKDQIYLVKAGKHTVIQGLISSTLCFGFIILPPSVKSFVYKRILRKSIQ